MARVLDSVAIWWEALLDHEKASRLIVEQRAPAGFDVSLATFSALLYAAYGASMGLFHSALAAFYSALKLPMLYLVTLAVCYPALYALNSQLGPRLSHGQTVRLLLMATSANAIALASYIPVSYFFVFTTSSNGYGFLVLMHVTVFFVAGLITLGVAGMLFRTTCRSLGVPLRVRFVLSWSFVYALVGTQASWVLRPWVGSVSMEYTFLREREGSFIQAVWGLIQAAS